MAPALLGAVLIVVAWSFDELVITFFTSGGDATLPVRIWGMLRRGIDPSVNAMASVILVHDDRLHAPGRSIHQRA